MLTIYTLIIGTFFLAVGSLALFADRAFGRFLKTFSRNKYAGMALSTIDLILTYFLLKAMPVGFLEQYKWMLIPLLPVAIILVNLYLDELLSARSVGGLFMILMAPVLNAARLDFQTFTPVLSFACYLIVVAGMYLTCLPYLMRDLGVILEYKGNSKKIESPVSLDKRWNEKKVKNQAKFISILAPFMAVLGLALIVLTLIGKI